MSLQMGHHQPPLVLSLSQIQSGGGLLIVNPHGNEQQAAPAPPHQGPLMNGLTPLPPTAASTASDVNGHLVHSTSSTRSDTSSNHSPLDTSGGVNVGATSPVSSAVRFRVVAFTSILDLNSFFRYDLLQTCLTLVWM